MIGELFGLIARIITITTSGLTIIGVSSYIGVYAWSIYEQAATKDPKIEECNRYILETVSLCEDLTDGEERAKIKEVLLKLNNKVPSHFDSDGEFNTKHFDFVRTRSELDRKINELRIKQIL